MTAPAGPSRGADGKLRPCGTCPWRRTTTTGKIPGGGMCHAARPKVEDEGWTVMACHLSTDAAPVACAGFVDAERRGGARNRGLRLALIAGWVSLDDYAELDPEKVYPTIGAMFDAHPDRPQDDVLKKAGDDRKES